MKKSEMFSSQKGMVIMRCDAGISERYGGNHIAVHKCVTSACTPSTYTMLYFNYFSIKVEKIKKTFFLPILNRVG